MSVTTTINPPAKGNSGESKKKFATYATTSAAAVMTGVASSKIISEFGGDNGENEDTGIEQTNSQSENCGASVQDVSGAGNADVTSSSCSSVSSGISSAHPSSSGMEVIPEEEPITSQQNGNSVSEVMEIDPAVPVENEIAESPVSGKETLDSDEVADAIIAEDRIDPDDIDMNDVINFSDINRLYTVEGESYTTAAFQDVAGNRLVMVDVDGDDVFDLVTDYNGNVMGEVSDVITVDDVELAITGDDKYLAHNGHEITDEFGADTIVQDIIY